MDDLVVNSKFTATIVDDQDANAATAVGEGVVESVPEASLVDDRKTLFDISSLGHGHNSSIVTDVKHTVLLEHRPEHVLNDDGRRRVGDKAGLFMKLLGEEIHSKVAVLTSLSRGGDTNDLARAALEDQKIANADVVARNSDGVGRHATFDDANILTNTITDTGRSTFLIHNDLLTLGAVVVRMERVEDPISGFLDAVAEGMIVAFVVVIAHL